MGELELMTPLEKLIEQRDRAQGEIAALKSLLKNTDYQEIKLAESLSDCQNADDMLARLQAFWVDHGDLVAQRRAWRASINELEDLVAELDAQIDELTPSDLEELFG